MVEKDELVWPPCRKCGCQHKMCVEIMATGHLEPLDICQKCIFKDCFINPISERISLRGDRELGYIEE